MNAQERIRDNVFGHFLYLPKKLGMVSQHESGFSVANSNIHTSMFNIVCDTRIEQFLKDEQNRDTFKNFFKDTIKEAPFYGALNLEPLANYRPGEDFLIKIIQEMNTTFNHKPYAWWMSDLCNPLWLVNVLVEHGFKEPSVERSMIYDLSMVDESSPPKMDLSVLVVDHEKTRDDFLSVLSCIDKDCVDFYKKLPMDAFIEDERLYVGYHQGTPVTIAILFTQEKMSGLYTLVTAPKYRKKGYATQMIQHLMHVAKTAGSDHMCLVSTKKDKLYDRLGFEPVSVFVCVESE